MINKFPFSSITQIASLKCNKNEMPSLSTLTSPRSLTPSPTAPPKHCPQPPIHRHRAHAQTPTTASQPILYHSLPFSFTSPALLTPRHNCQNTHQHTCTSPHHLHPSSGSFLTPYSPTCRLSYCSLHPFLLSYEAAQTPYINTLLILSPLFRPSSPFPLHLPHKPTPSNDPQPPDGT